jgi:hypothetical protein
MVLANNSNDDSRIEWSMRKQLKALIQMNLAGKDNGSTGLHNETRDGDHEYIGPTLFSFRPHMPVLAGAAPPTLGTLP